MFRKIIMTLILFMGIVCGYASATTYTHSLKQVPAPTAIVFDSLNDTSKISVGAGSLPTVSNGVATGSGGYFYYAGTSGWANQSMLVRLNATTNAGSILHLRYGTTSNVGYQVYTNTGGTQLCANYSNGSGGVNIVCNNFITGLAYTNIYVYAYSNSATTVNAIAFNEAAPGIIGQYIGSVNTTGTSTPTGYMGFSYGGSSTFGGNYTTLNGFPIIMQNYGSLNAPSFPTYPFVGQYFYDNFVNLSQEILTNNANYCGTDTTPLTYSNNTLTISGTAGQCVYANNVTNYQNTAAVVRFKPTTFSNNVTYLLKINSTGTYAFFLIFNRGAACYNYYNNGVYGTQTCGGTVATSTTGYYYLYGAWQYIGSGLFNVYVQVCSESSVGVALYSSCVTVNGSSIGAAALSNITTSNIALTAAVTSTTFGGAYPFYQIRDYGDGNVPQTLQTFLRGVGY